MKSRISALMDGELEAHELPSVFAAVAGSDSLRQDWRDYGLIGDAIRSEAHLEVDLTARVMAALQSEPTVLAPTRIRSLNVPGTGRRVMAMAASIAGVGVVAWMGLSMSVTTLPLVVQQAQVAGTVVQVAAKKEPAQTPSRRMSEYLVAHQTYAPAGQMQGGTRYIRTVAAER
jgi:sigma-E factor negative regulatory protein RseA